jgi:hypothetical protein
MVRSYLRLLNFSLVLSLLLPVVVALCSYTVSIGSFESPMQSAVPGPVLITAALSAALFLLLRRSASAAERLGREQESYLDGMAPAYLDLAIFGSAALSLFLELAVIRWQSEVFPLFAFYKNYSLLACFAGLGLGYALARRDAIPLAFSIAVLVFQFFVLLFLRYGIGPWYLASLTRAPFAEQFHMGLDPGGGAPYIISAYMLLAVVFALTATAFVPVGQLCGRLMARGENLRAYGFNLLGSILGVVLIIGASYFWTPPVVWFSVGFAALLAFQVFNSRTLLFGAVASLMGITVLAWPVLPGLERLHTPYQLVERGGGERGLAAITAAGLWYQGVHDLSAANANRETVPELKRLAQYYDLPYRIHGKRRGRVAVVGAGTGNDVAAALRADAGHVDAIEIDPAIMGLGRLYHPEHPYDDPRVAAIVNDARSFIRTTQNRYDMVVYGVLDSHTLLSHASSVRLDAFVYTVEGLKETRRRLTPDGMISLSFWVLSEELGRKLYLMMQGAFDGNPPVCVRAVDGGTVIYLQRSDGRLSVDPRLLAEMGYEDVSAHFSDPGIQADASTDDWPFLYMPRRVYPLSYLGMLGLLFVLSLLLILNFTKERPAFSSVTFSLLGAGFMLVETKAITELGLVFGNTWQVIGIAICGVLLMAFLANYSVQRFPVRSPGPAFAALFASLLLGFAVSQAGGLGSTAMGKLGTAVLLTCPLFFSGIVFSLLLGQARDVTGVMAMNLLGAMAGGVLEYNSLYFGFRFLYILAMGLFALAMVAHYAIGKTRAVKAMPGPR